jgi:death on curing protein
MQERLGLGDLLLIAEAVLAIPAERLARVVLIPAAESALAAPFATFGGVDFYSDPAERAAICCSRIIRNHPFPDGNKRIAYECLREMLERAGLPWPRPGEDAGEIVREINFLEAKGYESNFVAWVRARVILGERLRAEEADEATA